MLGNARNATYLSTNNEKPRKIRKVIFYLRLNFVVDKFIWTISRLDNRRKFKNISKVCSAHIFLEWCLMNHLWRRHEKGVSKRCVMNRNFLAYIIFNQSEHQTMSDRCVDGNLPGFFFLSLFFFRTTSSFKGNAWLSYSYATFQIFARNAVDGTPVQYGDIVAFKYPYGGRMRWLSYSSSYHYVKDCSSTNKNECASQYVSTGFKIFKTLWNASFNKNTWRERFVLEDFSHILHSFLVAK